MLVGPFILLFELNCVCATYLQLQWYVITNAIDSSEKNKVKYNENKESFYTAGKHEIIQEPHIQLSVFHFILCPSKMLSLLLFCNRMNIFRTREMDRHSEEEREEEMEKEQIENGKTEGI